MTKKHFIDLAKMIDSLTRNNCESLTKNNLINQAIKLCNKHNNNFNETTFIDYIEKLNNN